MIMDNTENKHSPGTSLKSILHHRNMSVNDLAKKLCINYNRLLNILNDKESLDLELCQSLEIVLGFRASYWITLQQAFNERNKRNLL